MSRFDISKYQSAKKVVQAAAAADPGELVQIEPVSADADIERAAIIEHDGKIPEQWADGFARLLCMQCPEGVKPHQWQRFIDDCGRFIDAWAEKAGALGWLAHDLFAVAGGKSFSRVDLAGLLWLLDGAEVVALTADSATIKTKNGATQTYFRVGPKPGQRMAWELRP